MESWEDVVRNKYSMFTEMATILKEKEGERFRLQHFTVTDDEVRYAQFRDRHAEYTDFIPGTYVKLVDKELQEIVMSDTSMEKGTNLSLYYRANGHVLIGGLGIGMILLAIQEKPEVTKITVIEKHQEVINLVASQLPLNEKVEIIHSDIFEWKAPRGVKYDTIYMDIWNNIEGQRWEEHKQLTKKFYRRVNKNNDKAWSSSWRRADYRRLAR